MGIKTALNIHKMTQTSRLTSLIGRVRSGCAVFVFTFLASTLCLVQNTYSNPQDGQVVAGSAVITTPAPNTMQINQSTNKAVIDWRTFNINANEHTHFQQPSTSSITLNRVNPANGASGIYGKLTANGQVWLVNPAGIHFGAGSYVNVGGLLATTANIRNDDFMNGRYRFIQSSDWSGAVINNGTIIANRGVIALFAPGVQNNGLVQADLGQVILASGAEYTLDFMGDQLIQFTVDSAITDHAVDENGQPLTNRISNTGQITANGGSVIMTVNVARGILDNVINNTGVVEAKSVASKQGEIILMAGDNGTVNVSGQLNASGKQSGESGGTIKVLGNKVIVTDNAAIDASGDSGGGKIYIGGDYLGNNPLIYNATNTFVGSDVTINADAITSGHGGRVIVWANDITRFYGKIYARGGAISGDGGFVETSGKNYLDVAGARVVASAPNGAAGTWLLDPRNVTINNSTTTCTTLPCFSVGDPTIYTPDTNNSNVLIADILAALEAGTSVTITTGTTGTQTGTIAVNAAITKASGTTPVTLTLDSSNAGGTITIASAITSSSGELSIVLNSGNNIAINNSISTNGGDFLGTAQNALTFNASGAVTTSGGSATFNANADGAGGQDFSMNAASSISTTNGAVAINVNTASGGTGAATLGNISTGSGTLSVATDNGSNLTGTAITQAGASTISAGSASFSTGNGNITLTNNNDFTGAVALTSRTSGRNISLTDTNSLILGQITMPTGTGNLTIVSNGAITQDGATTITSGTGLASFNSGATGAAITLANNNVFNGAVGITTTGVNNATLVNTGNLSLDNISVGGNLSVTANSGAISQDTGTRTIVVGGTSSFSAPDGSITIANNNNAFTGAVSLSNTGSNNVSLNNSIALVLGTVTVGNNLTVSTINAGSTISQNSTITVPGTASFSAGANAITINNASNQFSGAVSLTNSGANDVTLANGSALELGTSTIGRNLTLSAAGSITQTGSITASGGTTTVSVSTANSDILLDTQANNFGTSAVVFGGTLSNIRDVGIRNSNAGATISDFSGLSNLRNLTLIFTSAGITLPALTLHDGGNLSVTANGVTGGAINQSGALIIPGTATFTATTGTSALRDITLTNTSNQFSGAVYLTNSGTGSIDIHNSTNLILGDLSSGTGSNSLSGAGISQLSGTTITQSGTFTLAGNGGEINLTNSGNNIGGTVEATNTAVNDMNINNAITLSLGNITLTDGSDLNINSTGITQVANTSINTGSGDIYLNAGTGTLATNNNDLMLSTGQISLIADAMSLNTGAGSQIGGTGLGTGSASNVIIAPYTAGTSIGLAGGAGSLSLSQGELSNIHATNIHIGNAAAGALTVNTGATWAPSATFANNGVLTLESGSTISQGGGINLSGSSAGLIFRSASSVDFSNTNNIISSIAADVNGSISVTNSSTHPMTVTSITDNTGTVSGINASGDVNLTTSGAGGLLTVNSDINSGNGNISLNSVGLTLANDTSVNAGSGIISINAGGGAIQLNNGTLTTNASGSALTLQNATTIALGNVSVSSGTLTLGAGNVSGAITQNASTTIAANNFTANTTSSINLSNSGNAIANLGDVTRGGALTLANTSSLTIAGNISSGTVTNPVLITTTGALTINPGVTITGNTSGDAIVLSAASFSNNAGSSVFNTGSGRFLVWSQNPANDNRGGLAYNFKQYNAAYGSSPVLGTGNGFLYTLAPKIALSLTGSSTKEFDGTRFGAPLAANNYLASGAVDGDVVTTGGTFPTSGTYASPYVGIGIRVTATGLSASNFDISDGAATVYGYQLNSTEASGNIGVITPMTRGTIESQDVYPYYDPLSPGSQSLSGLGSGVRTSTVESLVDKLIPAKSCEAFSSTVLLCSSRE